MEIENKDGVGKMENCQFKLKQNIKVKVITFSENKLQPTITIIITTTFFSQVKLCCAKMTIEFNIP